MEWYDETLGHSMEEKQVKCENCHVHEGTQKWVGEEGFLAYTHGFTKRWCNCCCLKYQLDYAGKLMTRIPRLEKELAKKKCSEMKLID